ncbi:HTH domain-containing protein [Rhodobacter capsulatus]|uniref:HTH domain-containing protein n=1 Tax=Rhodobacter capsulatus TaxID=1061 RepID=A0A4U1JTQ1_RHOCA|nr:HTH domain-containing protein [Rhodobacter capsulatus]TKD22691.1 HTH domain-containing protein [Rhodobacter capsulatus]
MTRNERFEQILMLLRDGELIRARDVAARLGVSERTIWRDMAKLVDYGVPIEGERGVGYILRRPVALPPLVLTSDEMAALRHLLRLAGAHADTRIAAGARSLAAKIRAVMPPDPEEDDPV